MYIKATLEESPTISITFDLWMSHGHEDVFSIILHYISGNWESLTKSIGLVKVENTNGPALHDALEQHLAEYGCGQKLLACVVDGEQHDKVYSIIQRHRKP
mmetsp:Transcript_24625/g.38001  ORF Transcript_24625/g.38001 Transcript_24625/m.38001 type:complete len:101 (+) Transcript_24625:38-340(+)